jgi:hypothetical protein
MSSVFQFLHDLFQRDNIHLIRQPIGLSGKPANSQRDYFRIRLVEMFLTDRRNWFQTVFPALGSVTRCQFVNDKIELPNVVDPSKLVKPDSSTGLILSDVVICPTMPFRGGTVELTAVLKSMTVVNHLESFIKTLTEFSSLLAVPQLSAALAVAGPLAKGVQSLFASGDGASVLGYFETFDRTSLQEGHIALVAADEKSLDKTKLTVATKKLLFNGQPLRGFDYMLLRIEVFADRDDDQGIKSIYDPFNAALKSLAGGNVKQAEEEFSAAKLAAYQAPELTIADQRRVIESLKSQYDLAKKDFSQSGATAPKLEKYIANARKLQGTADEALERGPIRWEETF